MKVDFSNTGDREERQPLPPGLYPCRIIDAKEEIARTRKIFWKVRFQVETGPYADRYIFANIFWDGRALVRSMDLLKRVGIKVSGVMEVNPEQVIGRRCPVWVDVEDFTDASGRQRRGNVIPPDGFRRPNPDGTTHMGSDENPCDDDLPF